MAGRRVGPSSSGWQRTRAPEHVQRANCMAATLAWHAALPALVHLLPWFADGGGVERCTAACAFMYSSTARPTMCMLPTAPLPYTRSHSLLMVIYPVHRSLKWWSRCLRKSSRRHGSRCGGRGALLLDAFARCLPLPPYPLHTLSPHPPAPKLSALDTALIMLGPPRPPPGLRPAMPACSGWRSGCWCSPSCCWPP